MTWEPKDPDFERKVRESFVRQTIMGTIGADLRRVAPGEIEIGVPFRRDLAQQHGFLHAGVLTTVMDSACGYAALTLAPPGAGVLAIEFKANFLRPADGDVVARGSVLKPGRTVTVCRADAFVRERGGEKLVATMLGSIMTVRDRDGVVG
ncbi:MAG: PaaI family thioesterase [bacterium]